MLNGFKPFSYSVVSSIKKILTNHKKNFSSSQILAALTELL